MKKVSEYVTYASAQLNDQKPEREFTRWTRAFLVNYLNGALTEILSYKPDAFAEETNLTLVAGAKQELSNPGATLSAITANAADGSLVSEADLDLLRAFSPFNCCADTVTFDNFGNPDYRVKSFAIDPKNTSTYYVSPAVPAGLTPTVRANVIMPPATYTLDDWDTEVPIEAKYQETIIDYMMARALDIDTESPQSQANANKLFGKFYNALGVKYKVESAYRAGNYNGQIGDGDPRARLA